MLIYPCHLPSLFIPGGRVVLGFAASCMWASLFWLIMVALQLKFCVASIGWIER